jgi:hypothetical protein
MWGLGAHHHIQRHAIWSGRRSYASLARGKSVSFTRDLLPLLCKIYHSNNTTV